MRQGKNQRPGARNVDQQHGSSSTTSATALQAQLKADQRTLSEDQDKKASQEALETDQAKVTADQQAIDASQDKAKSTKESSPGKV
jgi:hypothetical protein